MNQPTQSFCGVVELLGIRKKELTPGEITYIFDVRWFSGTEKKETYTLGEVIFLKTHVAGPERFIAGQQIFIHANRLQAGGVQDASGKWEHKIRMYGLASPTSPMIISTNSSTGTAAPLAPAQQAVPGPAPRAAATPAVILNPEDPFAHDNEVHQSTSEGSPDGGFQESPPNIIAFDPETVILPE